MIKETQKARREGKKANDELRLAKEALEDLRLRHSAARDTVANLKETVAVLDSTLTQKETNNRGLLIEIANLQRALRNANCKGTRRISLFLYAFLSPSAPCHLCFTLTHQPCIATGTLTALASSASLKEEFEHRLKESRESAKTLTRVNTAMKSRLVVRDEKISDLAGRVNELGDSLASERDAHAAAEARCAELEARLTLQEVGMKVDILVYLLFLLELTRSPPSPTPTRTSHPVLLTDPGRSSQECCCRAPAC